MQHPAIPTPDLQWIREMVAPVMPSPVAIFLGGSRSGKVADPLRTSDYDVMLVSIYMTKPISLPAVSPHTGNKFDLILRDYETLAYEVESARQGGNGTLLHLGTHSQIVQEFNGAGKRLQRNLRTIYDAGPLPITRNSLSDELDKGYDALRWLRGEREPERFLAGSIMLTHTFGRLALRANRHWVANGKVIGRFLEAKLPVFKSELEAAALAMKPGDVSAMKQIVTDKIPALHVQSLLAVPYLKEYAYPANPDMAEAYHFARLSKSALKDYLGHKDPKTQACARDWVAFMFNLTSSAVDAERFSRPNREYHYALGRYLNQTSETLELVHGFAAGLQGRVELMADKAPDVLAALPAAVNGVPGALHAAVNKVAKLVNPEPVALQPRPSPGHLRLSPVTIGLI